jgi:hypothetical protein
MTTTSPAEELAHEISALQTQVGWLQEGVRLSTLKDAVEDIQTTVESLDQRLAGLRGRGYVFEKGLEAQATDYAQQWNKLYPSVAQQISAQAARLQGSLVPLETQVNQLAGMSNNPAAARPMLASLKTGIDTLKDKVSASERSIGGMYDQFNQQLSALTSHLDKVDWTLSQLAEASFQLLATEAGIMAVKAVWAKSGKEGKGDPQGVLYLTDQRLIFERKEEVATKKVLFIATEKETVQELGLEAPLALVEKVETSKQGLLKNEDHIEIKLAVGAPVQSAHFHIWQPCEEWQRLIQRAKAKDFDKERAVALDQAAVEKVKSAPSQCPSCGGNIQQVVLRGQDSLKCQYCGYVIRL